MILTSFIGMIIRHFKNQKILTHRNPTRQKGKKYLLKEYSYIRYLSNLLFYKFIIDMFETPRINFSFKRMLPQNLFKPIRHVQRDRRRIFSLGTSVDLLQRYIERWLNSQICKIDLQFFGQLLRPSWQ